MKGTTKTPVLSNLDGFISQEKERLEKRDALYEQAKEKIQGLQAEMDELHSQLDALNQQIGKDESAYLGIIKKHETRTQREIKKQQELQGKLRTGK